MLARLTVTGSSVNLYNLNNDKGDEAAKTELDALGQQIVTAYNALQYVRQRISGNVSVVLGGLVSQMQRYAANEMSKPGYQQSIDGINQTVPSVLTDGGGANATPGAAGALANAGVSPAAGGTNATTGSSTATDDLDGASSGYGTQANSSGDAARQVGAEREQAVADAVGGERSGEIIKTSAGKTDIDVVDPDGNIYAVGGPAKARNLGGFTQSLIIYSQTAAQRGVSAYFYYAEGTPQSVINAAIKVLGSDFVKPIP